jgi:FixJ family two-component response regulator
VLSEREREASDLVGQGRTNKAFAAVLFVSPATVTAAAPLPRPRSVRPMISRSNGRRRF